MTSYPLRRSDRALERDQALAVFDEAAFAVVSTVDDDGAPYGVPLSFARVGETLYAHAANAGGHKADDFRRDARVCVTAAVDVEAFFADGDFSTRYRSAMAFGRIRAVEEGAEFRRALVELCLKYVPAAKDEIGGAMERELPHTAVWAIDLDDVTGKANAPATAPAASEHRAGAAPMATQTETRKQGSWETAL